MTKHRIRARNGGLEFIYADPLAFLTKLGPSTTRRVSHVEPAPGGGWTADMVDGPVLGPFPLRQQALDAEVAWLRANRGL